ncbi:MAG: hypothetical protein HC771_20685 [Synechococcales cyanobacterium CRU_2_2]|nr:hypothetical protein [Synechococcales cyanobacterium CRU_2_2]
MTIGFIDNDIFLKLNVFHLFEEAIEVLGISQDEIRLLHSAKHVFRSKRKKKKRPYSEETWSIAIEIAEKSTPLVRPDINDSEIIEELQQIDKFRDQIDEGESILILAIRLCPSFLLLSGDKRCFKALPQLPPSMYGRLCGRVICLEQVVLTLIDTLGFEVVRDRIYPASAYDTAIKFCFGYSEPASEESTREALLSCIEEIQVFAPGLLWDLQGLQEP